MRTNIAAQIGRNLRQFVVQSIVSDAIAVQAARNYRTMRARGFTVRKMIAVLIGTFCLEGGHRLLHDDPDFDPMENLPGLAVLR
jgi:predicted nucleic acid-binding protein